MKISLRKRLWRSLRGHFRSKILSRHGVAILTETKNGTLAVDPRDFNVSRALLTQGEYDWNEIELLSRLLSRKSRIVVVGAHIGAVLIPLVRMAGIHQAIAYEPSPRNFKLLQVNVVQNGLDDVVELRNIAVDERQGRARFSENLINTGNSRLSEASGNVEVVVDTLDASMPTDWDWIDLLIMDVEGAEVRAMRGATRTLEKTQFLYVEFAPEQLQEQRSTAAEFVELAATYFKSAHILGAASERLDAAAFTKYLRKISSRRGLLLNILFSKDLES
jgi:FkbM family methyltransferase